MTNDAAARQRKSRISLLLIALAFIAPMIIAGALTLSGWEPSAKATGEPILPQRNFDQERIELQLPNGSVWPWRDDKPRFTLLALPGPGCAAACFETLTGIAKSRVMLNRSQDRLRLLYLGTPPTDADKLAAMKEYWSLGTDPGDKLAGFRPTTPDSLSVILVESNGTALSFYPSGFDGPGLLRDMRKVIK